MFRLNFTKTCRSALQKRTRAAPQCRWISLAADGKNCTLELEDGTKLRGISFGAETSISGELVFSTGMVGYTEALTDPSYKGQLLMLTYPMVGNYGVPNPKNMDNFGLPAGFESDRIHASALVVQDYSYVYSHWNAHSSLGDWLKENNVPGIHGIDTRMLTKRIRDKGSVLGKIVLDTHETPETKDPAATNIVAEVSCKEPRIFGEGNPVKVIAVDCGIKYNIIRQLVNKGAEVKVVPFDYPIKNDLEWADGIFLSNGPGDPTMCKETIQNLKELLELEGDAVKPIFGICLGNQLLGLAAGAKAAKLPYGNRGQNQPVRNNLTDDVYITPQNHGYMIEDSTLPSEWTTLFSNENDGSNEGIMHKTKPFFTAQFHPEACGGPTDTEFLFDVFLEAARAKKGEAKLNFPPRQGLRKDVAEKLDHKSIKKVLVLGSGGLSIGQAGEFDYSGAQAIKALKEEGKQVILMNPNIASVQTNTGGDATQSADQVFFLPVNPDFVEEVIKREKPDGILVSMGGQTALNCAVEMYRKGIFEKYGVTVLGTPIDVVIATEDRELFANKLNEIDEKMAVSIAVETVEDSVKAANEIGGFPVMIRSAFALGGLGSGICKDEAHLRSMAAKALSVAPQILVERSMLGWKEVEYEVVRDAADNCITVCNMENFDPMGVHTGDSVVISPSQTLSNDEYHMLRDTATKVVRHLGIVGECNIQYSLNPKSMEYSIIEVNARLSRSSALASKATGYPLAFVAAKLSLGITLPEIRNAITQTTQACFEPSLDYVVTKVPRWDLGKFQGVSTQIGSAMKSVGEVMAIGRTLEECFQKALRMVDPANNGYEPRAASYLKYDLDQELIQPSDRRVYAIAHAMYNEGYSVDKIHELTNIDKWFLSRLMNIVEAAKETKKKELSDLDKNASLRLKQLGFSDKQIAKLTNSGEMEVRALRESFGVMPFAKQIDTLAAEYPAQTNYLYMTYHGQEHDIDIKGGGAVVLGSGAYRIGSSVEFDWCSVSCIRTLRRLGQRTVMINYNPETVSTDYDECDQLYFEELTKERVLDVYNLESADGVVVSVGGQIPNNLALDLNASDVNVFGTHPDMIDSAEDRNKFSALMDSIGVEQAPWSEMTDLNEAIEFSNRVGYPVLVRPSYVLSGAAMNVAQDDEELTYFLAEAANVSQDHPVVISKFIEGAKEIEMDAVADKGEVVVAAIHEHVENAGVHSGDATLLLPAESLTSFMKNRVKSYTRRIAKALNITGPFNIQFIVKEDMCMVIECNLRASRSVPFVSKTMRLDFIETATKVMMGEDVKDVAFTDPKQWEGPEDYTAVKAPMFSFTRLAGADPVLGVEMASTGEVACFGQDKHEAFLKAMLSTGFKLPQKDILVTACPTLLHRLTPVAYQLVELGYKLWAPASTYEHLVAKGVECSKALMPLDEDAKKGADETPDACALIEDRVVDLVINLPTSKSTDVKNNYTIRRKSVDFGVPLLTNMQLVELFAEAMQKHKKDELVGLEPRSLFSYYEKEDPTETWSSPKEFH
mmetsp:Transcript_12334/g.25096  ORF Transcript_12334/g.25096 Transcript_12334/m.25096 type:complete len:1519 (-) Transcript_12334:252-4808(-)